MSGLMIDYSKEIAKELTKTAVVLPGEPVEIGDIIHFPRGRRGIWPFRKPAPIGSFKTVSSLEYLGIDTDISPPDREPDPYIFSSKKRVTVDFELNSDVAIGDASVSGNLSAKFHSEGAIYFAAIDVSKRKLRNLIDVEINLREHRSEILWRDTFIVTSVSIADKALIMQSSTDSGSLEISGDVKGLVTEDGEDISADSIISVDRVSESSIIKLWSDKVTVFMELHRFRKKDFGVETSDKIAAKNRLDDSEYAIMASEFLDHEDDTYELEAVSALESLREEDMI